MKHLKKMHAEEKLIAEIAREAIEKSGEAISTQRARARYDTMLAFVLLALSSASVKLVTVIKQS